VECIHFYDKLYHTVSVINWDQVRWVKRCQVREVVYCSIILWNDTEILMELSGGNCIRLA